MQTISPCDLHFSVVLNSADAPQALALIRAFGPDAGSFLQGQLTQDVLLMKESEARLAAWCSAKGRMLSSMIVWKNSPEEFYLLLSADLLANTLKRLKMFVMRAKCELTDATALFHVAGLAGDCAIAMNLVASEAMGMPATSPKPLEKAISLPAAWMTGQAVVRALHITPTSKTLSQSQAAQPPDAALLARWHYLEITSGIARLSAPISEAFMPQMLNYESVGGVNFKKGCYPGQEVVARSQFRGTLKRRAYLVHSPEALQAGQEVFDGQLVDGLASDQPCGMVAQAAPDMQGGYLAIVSMQTAAASSADLRAGVSSSTIAGAATGHAAGAQLSVQSLPYALLEDI